MSIQKDTFKFDGENTVFKCSNKFIEGSLKIVLIKNDSITDILNYELLGDGYILVFEDTLQKGDIVEISYDISTTTPLRINPNTALIQRVVQLEKSVALLHETNQALVAALNNRISVSTFQAWTKLIEKKTGINLIDDKLGYISQELYNPSKE